MQALSRRQNANMIIVGDMEGDSNGRVINRSVN